jgi:hypothetical protein
MEIIGCLFVFGGVAYVGFHAYLFFAKPELWAQMQQRSHEARMAKLAEEEAKRKAATGGLLAGIARVVIDTALKGKPHN